MLGLDGFSVIPTNMRIKQYHNVMCMHSLKHSWQELSYCQDGCTMLQESSFRFQVGVVGTVNKNTYPISHRFQVTEQNFRL